MHCWANAHTKRYTPDSVDTEIMMDYYNHDERERKQMHHSSGSVRIYRAEPDESNESNESGGSSGGNGSSGGGGEDCGSGSGDIIEKDADTNKLDYNYY